MGYNTDFQGVLKFTKKLKQKHRNRLEEIFEIDYRQLGEEECEKYGKHVASDLSYIDLRISDDSSGIEWSGGEKTYNLDSAINLVIMMMRENFPKFGLSGEIFAQGEGLGDTWKIVIDESGFAKSITLDPFTEKRCSWELLRESLHKTECGLYATLMLGFIYCPYCGGKLEIKAK